MENVSSQSNRKLLKCLDSLKHRYAPGIDREKIEILTVLETRELTQPSQVRKLHDILCFLQAYPDNGKLLALVDRILLGFQGRFDRMGRAKRAALLESLADTGIAGTNIYYPFSYATALWLHKKFPDDIKIDWEAFEERDKLGDFIPLFVSGLENDAIDDEDVDMEEWLVSGIEEATDFAGLMKLFLSPQVSYKAKDTIYELLNVPLIWKLRADTASRTVARCGLPRGHYQKNPLDRAKGNARSVMKRPLRTMRRVSPAKGREYIDAGNKALSVRLRELYPLLYASADDAHVIDVGRGVSFILIGMDPRHRMPIETTYYFLVFKNGVPVGYGCGSVLIDRCEIAANIFPAFRQGESAFLYSQILRVFHQVFKSSSFLLEKYQIGHENSEAINSGAFWFYYKLGFRPVAREARKTAAREMKKISGRKGYRTPPKVLKELAESDMLLNLTRAVPTASRLKLGRLGGRVTAFINSRFGGDRRAAERRTLDSLRRILGIRSLGGFSAGELASAKALGLLVAQIPDLEDWPRKDKRSLLEIMRSKGGKSEIPFVHEVIKHKRLVDALIAMSRGR